VQGRLAVDADQTKQTPALASEERHFSSAVLTKSHAALARTIRGIEIALTCAFIVAVLLNFLTAADRYVFKRSIVGSDEIQIYIMIYMTFLGAAVVSWKQRHLRMDVLASIFPHGVRIGLIAAESILVVVLLGILSWQSLKYVMLMATIDRRSDLAAIPMWIPHLAVALGFALIVVVTCWHLLGLFAGGQQQRSGHGG
jgi:TRAP-type C4-dicarboxylate transport system permease small subunit